MRSCKRRNKGYINKLLSKKIICEAKNESQCFFVDDNNGLNRDKEYYQKIKRKWKIMQKVIEMPIEKMSMQNEEKSIAKIVF